MPKEALVSVFGLIHSFLQNGHLMAETVQVGQHHQNKCLLMCISNVALSGYWVIKIMLNHNKTTVISLMKGFILLHVCMRKSSSLLWFSNANAGGSLWKLYDSNTALGLFVVKKEKEKKSALHHPAFHSRGKWPSLQWWYKDCVSYLMPVIFWHVGRSGGILCVIARGIMVMVGVGLIKK